MTLFLFAAWIFIHALLINIAVKIGWNHDPGYAGPILLVLVLNITLALYATRNKTES
jgi:hypothetical protein